MLYTLGERSDGGGGGDHANNRISYWLSRLCVPLWSYEFFSGGFLGKADERGRYGKVKPREK